MSEQRSTIEFTVDGLSIAALTAGPAAGPAAAATSRNEPCGEPATSK